MIPEEISNIRRDFGNLERQIVNQVTGRKGILFEKINRMSTVRERSLSCQGSIELKQLEIV